MKKHIFEENRPSGVVRVEFPEKNITTLMKYIADKSFLKKGDYEQYVSKIEENNPDKILIVVNDNSNHGRFKRSYIAVYTEEELTKDVLKFNKKKGFYI